MRVRTSLTGVTGFLILTALALGQTSDEQSAWSSAWWTFGPILLLIVVCVLLWKRFGLGKGGYRKLINDNQERMAQMERHLGEISRQLERIATSLERPRR